MAKRLMGKDFLAIANLFAFELIIYCTGDDFRLYYFAARWGRNRRGMTMPRYILIDNCSGIIWGDSETIEHESPEAYAADIDQEERKWSEIIRRSGAKADGS